MDKELLEVWKLVLSLIHMDGVVSSSEEKWFKKKIDELKSHKLLNATEEDIVALGLSFNRPIGNYAEAISQIKTPARRSFVLHMVRTIGHLDNNFCDNEKKVFKDIESIILSDFKIEDIEAQNLKMELDSYEFNNYYQIDERDSFITVLAKVVATYL
ncbi:hypothetical protein M902_2602 [Bacteriovorax sp. BAL6_X]|uniref:hypothetical protein n=1 Tax=Bacteriovorax sp. BAL6_X TaxID=1201290 RepID=UPI00038570CA|nr:hypothetical protein [Bacteriovorax sp. BAL6_X]EPZ50959.1 hypothetical protein M902_2602 [Bacteriovorax sp. BAL6_X]